MVQMQNITLQQEMQVILETKSNDSRKVLVGQNNWNGTGLGPRSSLKSQEINLITTSTVVIAIGIWNKTAKNGNGATS